MNCTSLPIKRTIFYALTIKIYLMLILIKISQSFFVIEDLYSQILPAVLILLFTLVVYYNQMMQFVSENKGILWAILDNWPPYYILYLPLLCLLVMDKLKERLS